MFNLLDGAGNAVPKRGSRSDFSSHLTGKQRRVPPLAIAFSGSRFHRCEANITLSHSSLFGLFSTVMQMEKIPLWMTEHSDPIIGPK